MVQRYYSNNSGRFFSPDPGGVRTADPTDPGSWNRYAYVNGDPMNGTDPHGLYAVVCYDPDATDIWDGSCTLDDDDDGGGDNDDGDGGPGLEFGEVPGARCAKALADLGQATILLTTRVAQAEATGGLTDPGHAKSLQDALKRVQDAVDKVNRCCNGIIAAVTAAVALAQALIGEAEELLAEFGAAAALVSPGRGPQLELPAALERMLRSPGPGIQVPGICTGARGSNYLVLAGGCRGAR